MSNRLSATKMTSLEQFKEILKETKVKVPEDSLEVFRDLVDMQADIILDEWLESKGGCKGVK